MAFTPEQRAEIDRLTQEAMELPPADREAFVRQRCSDPAVTKEVVGLLAALHDTGASNYLDHPAELPTALAAGDDTLPSAGGGSGSGVGERIGDQLGPYTLVGELGEGGFGIVWLANQQEPVRRQVALKIIKPGMDTRQVLQRFDAERQALALMEHEGIARVLDGGATQSGRPYFVMEYVAGMPITDFCDENRLAFPARLELFVAVCEAVQHAHQKGIIHRDIKPSNVLVTVIDGRPVAKVIDFGIAKAIDQQLTEHSLFTELGQFIGTPTYMSPEQADPQQDIDTRSDIYSLGVLLYELLTGTTPFDLRTLRAGALDEIKRIIREEEPRRPSTRLSTLGEERSTVAEQRQLGVRKLGTVLRGDLDWIIMKALEKDRGRRYGSAVGLAADIRRHLRHEAVEASPPSAVYRLSRLVRRNRGVFAGAGLVALSLIGGTIGTSIGLFRARAAEELARQEADRATREAVRSVAVANLLTDALAGVGPSVALGRDTKLLEEVLQRTEARIDTDLAEQPEVEAYLRATLAATYLELGAAASSEVNSRRALYLMEQIPEPDLAETARQYNTLGMALELRSCFDEARQSYRKALALWAQVPAADDPDRSGSIGGVSRNLGGRLTYESRYAEARGLLEDALEMFTLQHGDVTHSDHATVFNAFGNLERFAGNYDAARSYYEQAMQIHRSLPDGHPFVGNDLFNLGGLLCEMGQGVEGERLLREAIALQTRVLGPHPDLAESYFALGSYLYHEGRFAEAEPVIVEGLRLARETQADSLALGDHLISRALLCSALGREEDALVYYDEALALRRAIDPDPAVIAQQMSNIAYAHMNLGDHAKAERMFRASIATQREATPEGSRALSTLLNNLGRCLRFQEKPDEAIAVYTEVLAMRRALFGQAHPQIANTLNDLGGAYAGKKDFERALSFRSEAVQMYADLMGPEHLYTRLVERSLAEVLIQLERYEEAEALLQAAVEAIHDAFGPTHLRALDANRSVATILVRTGRLAEAETLLQRVAETLEGQDRPAAEWERTVKVLVELYELLHREQPDGGYDALRERWREALPVTGSK